MRNIYKEYGTSWDEPWLIQKDLIKSFDKNNQKKRFLKSLKMTCFQLNEKWSNNKYLGIFWHNHKIGMLNDKCAKNHLKMRSFDWLKKLLKFVKKN